MFLEISAIVGGTLCVMTWVSLHYANKLVSTNKLDPRDDQNYKKLRRSAEGLNIVDHVGPIDKCFFCGTYTSEKDMSGRYRAVWFMDALAKESWHAVQGKLIDMQNKKTIKVKAGPTDACFFGSKDGAYMYQACGSCGSQWLVYPSGVGKNEDKVSDEDDIADEVNG